MIITNTISIHRIITGTWKHLIINIILCSLTYILYHTAFPDDFQIPVLIPTVMGTALAFFIGFNNNQAYDRWWEARKIWGALVNDSRSWTRQVLHYRSHLPESQAERDYLDTAVYRHIGFIYALKQNLRNATEEEFKKYISEQDYKDIAHEDNKANAILSLQSRDLNKHYKSGIIDGFQFIELNEMLINFCDEMGKSERIANTVFPTTYEYYTRMFIWFFIIFLTIVTAPALHVGSIFIGTLIGYVFLTIHKIGESLLNPFDEIPTGIPLNSITRTIEINLLQTLRKTDIPEYVESVDGEYIM